MEIRWHPQEEFCAPNPYRAYRFGTYTWSSTDPTNKPITIGYYGDDARAMIALNYRHWQRKNCAIFNATFPPLPGVPEPPLLGDGTWSLPSYDPTEFVEADSAPIVYSGGAVGPPASPLASSSSATGSSSSDSDSSVSSMVSTLSSAPLTGSSTSSATGSQLSSCVSSNSAWTGSSSSDSEGSAPSTYEATLSDASSTSTQASDECIMIQLGQLHFFMFNEQDGRKQRKSVPMELGYRQGFRGVWADNLSRPTSLSQFMRTSSVCTGHPFIGVGRRVRVVEWAGFTYQLANPFIGCVGVVTEGPIRSGYYTVRIGTMHLRFLRANLVDTAMESWYNSLQATASSQDGAMSDASCADVPANPYMSRIEQIVARLGDARKIRQLRGSDAPDTNQVWAGVNIYIRHLRLQHAAFKCCDCNSLFSATTSRALDLSHRDPSTKAEHLRAAGVPKGRSVGLHLMGLLMDTATFTTEVFEGCDVRCVACHRLKDYFISDDEGKVPSDVINGWSRQQQEYAKWRRTACQYGTDPARDHGREWRDGTGPAGSCLFDGTVEGWPNFRVAFGRRCNKQVPILIMVACLMEGDHTGLEPVKNERLRRGTVHGVYQLPSEEFQKELTHMRPLCFGCHRWVTHGPPDVTTATTYGEVYAELLQGLGNPLTDSATLKDFEEARRDWPAFVQRRLNGP